MFRLTKPAMVFVDSENVDTLEEALIELTLDLPIFVFGDSRRYKKVEELFAEIDEETQFIPPNFGDAMNKVAIIASSAGTTGLSKGVSISNGAMLNNMNVA